MTRHTMLAKKIGANFTKTLLINERTTAFQNCRMLFHHIFKYKVEKQMPLRVNIHIMLTKSLKRQQNYVVFYDDGKAFQ